MVGEGGFEPPKSLTTDLQSAPFGHSGTLPYSIGAGRRTRTPDLLITNPITKVRTALSRAVRTFSLALPVLFGPLVPVVSIRFRRPVGQWVGHRGNDHWQRIKSRD